MSMDKCELFEYALTVIRFVKELYDMEDYDAVEEIGDCSMNEDFDAEGFEKIYEAAPFEVVSYDDYGDSEKIFCSSEDMTEFYRIARKIGKLRGWTEENNRYINQSKEFVWNELRGVRDNFNFFEKLYTGTRHKYASSVIIYIYPEFYQYWDLYFALRRIFNYYSEQKTRLESRYQRLTTPKYIAEIKEAA